jgi:hypothetical protein
MSAWKQGIVSGTGKKQELYRSCKFAGPGHRIENGATVEECMNYGASNGFNAKEWPVVNAHVPLPAGREDLRALLAEHFRCLIDGFIKEHGLEMEEGK